MSTLPGPPPAIGQYGLSVSPQGWDEFKLGRKPGRFKLSTAVRIAGDKTGSRLLALAQDLGINLIDTRTGLRHELKRRLVSTPAGGRQEWDYLPARWRRNFEQGQSQFRLQRCTITRRSR